MISWSTHKSRDTNKWRSAIIQVSKLFTNPINSHPAWAYNRNQYQPKIATSTKYNYFGKVRSRTIQPNRAKYLPFLHSCISITNYQSVRTLLHFELFIHSPILSNVIQSLPVSISSKWGQMHNATLFGSWILFILGCHPSESKHVFDLESSELFGYDM